MFYLAWTQINKIQELNHEGAKKTWTGSLFFVIFWHRVESFNFIPTEFRTVLFRLNLFQSIFKAFDTVMKDNIKRVLKSSFQISKFEFWLVILGL